MIEIHHSRFPRRLHADPMNHAIREHPTTKFEMHDRPHDRLHQDVIYTPPFPNEIGCLVLKYLDLTHDPAEKAQAYLYAVERAMKHPRITRRDRQLGDLAITCFEDQLPYILGEENQKMLALSRAA